MIALARRGREAYGKLYPDCGASIQRIRYAENETNYCPPCQTGGRLLADRALSRLLKKDWPRTPEKLEALGGRWEESVARHCCLGGSLIGVGWWLRECDFLGALGLAEDAMQLRAHGASKVDSAPPPASMCLGFAKDDRPASLRPAWPAWTPWLGLASRAEALVGAESDHVAKQL